MSITECPRCGWNRASTTGTAHIMSPAVHEPAVSTDEIPLLEDEVRRLDEVIFRLNEERAANLRKINSARSTTRRLPPEILSAIFQFVSPPFNFIPPFASHDFRKNQPYLCDEMFQYSVTAVSHLWRQAAISTPQLWTPLSLAIHQSFNNVNLLALAQFAQNARRQPMSIELDFRDQESSWSDDRAESLLLMEPIREGVFVHYAARIQSLRLIMPPHEWFPHLKNLSQCDTVVVARPSRDDDLDPPSEGHLDLTELPYLRHVVLVDLWGPFSLPCSGITTLHLSKVPIITCMELLITCPRLVEFASYSSRYQAPATAVTSAVNKPITLEHIEYLTWSNDSYSSSPSIRRCISYLRFSKLRALQWSDDISSSPDEGRDQRLDFFSNLPITLCTLTLNRFYHLPQELILPELLYSTPHLRELHFVNCDAQCVEAVIKTIGRPFVPSPKTGQDPREEPSSKLSKLPNQMFLPHLSKLSVTRESSSTPLDGHIFVDMLGALYASGTLSRPEQFQLTIDDPCIDWNDDALDRMRTFVALGFSVKITGVSGFF